MHACCLLGESPSRSQARCHVQAVYDRAMKAQETALKLIAALKEGGGKDESKEAGAGAGATKS